MENERPFLSIVIPAYNEEKRLPECLGKIFAFLAGAGYAAEVLVVDDGSEDRTAEIAGSFTAQYPNLRLIENPHRGKAYAVRTGMLAAQARYILFTDVDLSAPIQQVERLLPWFAEGYQVVIGSREGIGARRIGEPFLRHLMGRAFNLAVQLLAFRGIADTQCGFKAFTYEAAQDLFSRLQLYGEAAGPVRGSLVTGFDVEVLFLAQKRGYRIKEVPVEWYYSASSKVNPLKDSWRNFRDVVRVRLNDMRGRYT